MQYECLHPIVEAIVAGSEEPFPSSFKVKFHTVAWYAGVKCIEFQTEDGEDHMARFGDMIVCAGGHVTVWNVEVFDKMYAKSADQEIAK